MDNSSAEYTAKLDGEDEEVERIVENGKRERERGRGRNRRRTASGFHFITGTTQKDSLAEVEINPSLPWLSGGWFL